MKEQPPIRLGEIVMDDEGCEYEIVGFTNIAVKLLRNNRVHYTIPDFYNNIPGYKRISPTR